MFGCPTTSPPRQRKSAMPDCRRCSPHASSRATEMRKLAPGDEVGGFRLVEKFHSGGLGTLWTVTRPDITAPLVMKLPFLLPGEDPLTIVSYETEQMIMPRLSGSHVPRFVAAGDFDGPYLVMERIHGVSLKDYLPKLPL